MTLPGQDPPQQGDLLTVLALECMRDPLQPQILTC